MDILDEKEMNDIQNVLNHFLEHNELNISPKNTWIPEDVMYAPTKDGGFNMVNIRDFFHALKNNCVRRYIHGLDDHWADLLDEQLKCDIDSSDKLLKIGSEHPRVNKIIDLELPCISDFLKSYKKLTRFSMVKRRLRIIGGSTVQYSITLQS